MRTVSATLESAITNPLGYTSLIRATAYPSAVFFAELNRDFSDLELVEGVGVHDDVVLQQISYVGSGSPGLVTWYNSTTSGSSGASGPEGGVSGTLGYAVDGEAGIVWCSGRQIYGKPGAYQNSVAFVNGTDLRVLTLDPALVEARSTNPFTSGSSGFALQGKIPMAVHLLDDTHLCLLCDVNGGLRVYFYVLSGGNWLGVQQPYRFMFPSQYDYTSGSPARSMQSLAAFSGAAIWDGALWFYISNCASGSVQGIRYDLSSGNWSDIFTAVPADLQTSLAEVRVANCFVQDSMLFLVVQFRRIEPSFSEDDQIHTLILRSTDGFNFSMDRFALVSDLGYRMQGMVADGQLFLSGCNRTSGSPATYIYTDTDPVHLDIPGAHILSYSDDSFRQATLGLAAGSEVYMTHPYLQVGTRVVVEQGLKTSGSPAGERIGHEFLPSGSFIIDGIPEMWEDGKRSVVLSLVNETEWKTAGLSSPFYTEIVSRSSIRDNLTVSDNLYPADSAGYSENFFWCDFWNSEGYANAAYSITAQNIAPGGAPDECQVAAPHKVGFRTQELTVAYDLEGFPELTATSIHVKIYGWSRSNNAASQVNDQVGVLIFTKDVLTDESNTLHYFAPSGRWKNTWPSHPSPETGINPIEYDLTGFNIGDKIERIGLVLESANATSFVPARVEITSGISVMYSASDTNTSWTVVKNNGFKLPGMNRAYIMYSQKPFNTFNFLLQGRFRHTLSGYISQRVCGYGLVGLGQDAKNYIVGRYNISTDRLQIVKVRNGSETLLAEATPGLSVGEYRELMFSHRDGTFVLYIKNDSGNWVARVTYVWTAADGWMFTDKVAPMNCGIYGIKDAPSYRITGYDPGAEDDEGYKNADGIGMLPCADYGVLNLFPAGTHKIKIGRTDIYTYSSKRLPAEIRGPYMFRNNGGGGTAAHYEPPYGTGQPGCEIRDFEWDKASGSYTGYLIAFDDGGCYTCTDSDFTVWITTGGVQVDLLNRARYYDGDALKLSYHDTSNRVFITGGLAGIVPVGEVGMHYLGDVCTLLVEGDIYCLWFMGTGGDSDATVRDLIDKISRTCAGQARFPGDQLTASLALTGGVPAVVGTDQYAQGFDLRWTMTPMTNGTTLTLTCNSGPSLGLEHVTGNDYNLVVTSGSDAERFNFSADLDHSDMRVLFHGKYVSVYHDYHWIYTFSLPTDPVYPTTLEVSALASASYTLQNVLMTELSDWRDAVYIDLETDGRSAISSVIQERPIDILHRWDGSIAYWYVPQRTTVNNTKVERYETAETTPGGASSDALVYYSEVKTMQHRKYAAKYGFSTHVYRLPNLDVGALKAAKVLLQKLYEGGVLVDLVLRPDLRLELGDLLHIDLTVSGSRRHIVRDVIVESIKFSYGPNRMQVHGRVKDE